MESALSVVPTFLALVCAWLLLPVPEQLPAGTFPQLLPLSVAGVPAYLSLEDIYLTQKVLMGQWRIFAVSKFLLQAFTP